MPNKLFKIITNFKNFRQITNIFGFFFTPIFNIDEIYVLSETNNEICIKPLLYSFISHIENLISFKFQYNIKFEIKIFSKSFKVYLVLKI